MKLNKLALSISRGVFLLDPRFILGYASVVTDFMEGKKVSFFEGDEEEAVTPKVAVRIGDSYRIEPIMMDATASMFAGYPTGSIAIIPVEGMIMQDDYCGAPGTETLTSWMQDARDSSNISDILLVVNSGGGTVTGTKEFADEILAVDQIKPVYAFGKGMIGSAAYWIASSAREIWVSSETVEVGSIGTAAKYNDNREAMKKYGVTQHYVNADSSPHKNQVSFKAIDGDYSMLKLLSLNPTNDIFLNSVKSARGDKLKLRDVTVDQQTFFEPLTGHVYLANEAKDLGLIEGIKSFDQMISYISSKKAPTRKSNMSKFLKLSGLVNKAANTVTPEELTAANEELTASGVNFQLTNAEAMQKLNSDLEAAQLALTTANGELTTAKAALTTANGKITTLETAATTLNDSRTEVDGKLTTAEAKIVELESKIPGGTKPAKPISKGDSTTTAEDKPMSSWMAKAANKVGSPKE